MRDISLTKPKFYRLNIKCIVFVINVVVVANRVLYQYLLKLVLLNNIKN